MLGAPLKNPRYSWGAVRPTDGVVFLRVWQDESSQIEGKTFMRLTNRKVSESRRSDHGYQERRGHVELLRGGARCCLILCVARDPGSTPRAIESFDRRHVFVGGGLSEIDGDVWIELGRRVDVADVMDPGVEPTRPRTFQQP